MMLAKFRQRYPQGSLVSELVEIDRGLYIVKVSVQVENIILATALAGADRVETAEDAARERAIAALMLDTHPLVSVDNSTPVVNGGTTATTSGKTEPAIIKQEPIKIENNNSTSHTNIVNFSKHQSELPSQPKTSNLKTSTLDIPTSDIPTSEVMPSASIPESPVSQLIAPEVNEAIPAENPPMANPGSLFKGTFTSETSENSSLADHNIIAETSPPIADSIITDTSEMEAIDFNEIKQKTDIEIRRLGWTKDDGREFLKTRYGKRSRLHLTDEQLLEFLHYLESLPNPS